MWSEVEKWIIKYGADEDGGYGADEDGEFGADEENVERMKEENVERMKEENMERGWKDEDRAKQGSREDETEK